MLPFKNADESSFKSEPRLSQKCIGLELREIEKIFKFRLSQQVNKICDVMDYFERKLFSRNMQNM